MVATTGPLDACKTPAPPAPVPPPMPYPNMGDCTTAGDCAAKVKMGGSKVCTTKSGMSRSSGDEPGVAGGIVSGRNMADIKYKSGSSKVKVEGESCTHLGSMCGHNGSNANVPAGVHVAPSQTTVIVGP